jgi:hypothetical protein
MRQPDPFTPTAKPVDRRLTASGLAVTAAELAAVFVDHRPGDRRTCPACRHRYTTAAPLCPSRALAAQLLKRRRHEDPGAFRDVAKELDANDTRALPAPKSPAPPESEGMFAVDPAWHKSKPTRPVST